MRGLTATERVALRMSDATMTAPTWHDERDVLELHAALEGLAVRGCVVRGHWIDEQGREMWGYTTNARGLLALRVCPD